MKHVWILNHYAQEPTSAGGTRHFHFAEHLKAHGWNASIIAASVEHQNGNQRLRRDEGWRIEHYRNVLFLWLRTPTYSGNKLWRILNIAGYFLQVIRPSVTKNLDLPDIIIGSSVHPLAGLAGLILARRHDVPFIFEVRDLWPQTLIDMGRLKELSLITWALRKIELFLYRRAARVIVLLPQAWEYIVPLGIPRNKIVWIPNGVDLAMFPRPADPPYGSDFNLMYFGSHGLANGLDNLVRAMKVVQSSPEGQRIFLRIIGHGPLKPALINLSNQLELKNVFFEKSVPKDQIPMLAAQADAFILTVLDLPNLYRYGISMNKIFDYLAASRPILIASNAANNPISDACAGLTIPPNNPYLLAQAILKIAATPLDARIQMGCAGRSYVEHNHGFEQLTETLVNTLNEACDEQHKKIN